MPRDPHVQKNELIRLDAVLMDVIDHAVFWARLANGHAFVAVARTGTGDPTTGCRVGDRVTVEFSPFDMATARVVSGEGEGSR
jgi:translation initiation factor IF-1